MTRLPVVVALTIACVALAIASFASARAYAVTGKLTVTGDNGDYVLTIENASTSTGNIRCWRWTLGQGAMVTAASRADGWRLGLSKPAPAPIIAGQIVPPGDGIPPGGKQTFRILTDKPFDGNGSPGTAAISEDCKTDASVDIDFGTPPKPQPKPEPKPCACKDLKTRIVSNRSHVNRSDARGFDLELLFQWSLTCTKGPGTCNGELTLAPSVRAKRLGITVASPAGTVTCNGPCAKTTTRFQRWVVTGGAKWAQGKRGRDPKLLRLEMKRVCTSKRLPQVFEIVFNRSGGIDLKLSDLNANGIQDSKD